MELNRQQRRKQLAQAEKIVKKVIGELAQLREQAASGKDNLDTKRAQAYVDFYNRLAQPKLNTNADLINSFVLLKQQIKALETTNVEELSNG